MPAIPRKAEASQQRQGAQGIHARFRNRRDLSSKTAVCDYCGAYDDRLRLPRRAAAQPEIVETRADRRRAVSQKSGRTEAQIRKLNRPGEGFREVNGGICSAEKDHFRAVPGRVTVGQRNRVALIEHIPRRGGVGARVAVKPNRGGQLIGGGPAVKIIKGELAQSPIRRHIRQSYLISEFRGWVGRSINDLSASAEGFRLGGVVVNDGLGARQDRAGEQNNGKENAWTKS